LQGGLRSSTGCGGAQNLSPENRKFYITDEEAWLGPALLEAAEQGRLLEVAQLLARSRASGGETFNPSQLGVTVEYLSLFWKNQRPPSIGELLEKLGIQKPKGRKENDQECSERNNRERVIRKMLTHFGLPLTPGKRGRPPLARAR
jgi:hypothetical protein